MQVTPGSRALASDRDAGKTEIGGSRSVGPALIAGSAPGEDFQTVPRGAATLLTASTITSFSTIAGRRAGPEPGVIIGPAVRVDQDESGPGQFRQDFLR